MKSKSVTVHNSSQESKVHDAGEVYQTHNKRLRSFINKRVSNTEEAEDILQNVFLSLAKADQVENPIAEISSWLFKVTRNQITDRYRKKKESSMPQPQKSDDDNLMGEISELLLISEDNPESAYFRSLVWEELEASLAELPDEQRSVFILNEIDGVSFSEISETTGIPVNTLISRKRYAVLYLRESLAYLYECLLDF